jgi:hypothetical protein
MLISPSYNEESEKLEKNHVKKQSNCIQSKAFNQSKLHPYLSIYLITKVIANECCKHKKHTGLYSRF